MLRVIVRKCVSVILLLIGLFWCLSGIGGIVSGDIILGLVVIVIGLVFIYAGLKLWKLKQLVKEAIDADSKSKPENIVKHSSNDVDHPITNNFNNEILHTSTQQKKSSNESVDFIKTYVAGLNFENRKSILKRYINQLKKEGEFLETYEGLKNKEILENGWNDEDNPLWELEAEIVEDIFLVKEPNNEYDSHAIKVLLTKNLEEPIHIGYLPKEVTRKISEYIDYGYNVTTYAYIMGGNYKFIDIDDFGEDKIYTKSKDYYLELEISISKKAQ